MYLRRWTALGCSVLAGTIVIVVLCGGVAVSGSRTPESITAAYMAAVRGAETSSGASEVPAKDPGSPALVEPSDDPEPPASGISCDSVVHIGDSTSEGLVDINYLPTYELIGSQYRRVGARTVRLDVSGARSIYERFQGEPNAQEAAASWKARGFDGCWVVAMATNEAANVAAGSTFGYDERIDSMMETIGRDQPVLWVNAKTLDAYNSYYADENMRAWNAALLAACDRYPNMRVYDWASDVRDAWFISDGIHFTSDGYEARGRLIANALYQAFPEGGDAVDGSGQADCLVEPPAHLPGALGRTPGAPLPKKPSKPGPGGAKLASAPQPAG